MWPHLNDCNTCNENDPCIKYSTNSIEYIGPNLPCTEIENKDSLTTIIQKLEQKICTLTPDYKTYEIIFHQEDTSEPIITVITNELGSNVVWNRSNIGDFFGTLIGAFPPNRTTIYATGSNNSNIKINNTDADNIEITLVDPSTGTPVDGITKLSLLVKVKNI